MILAEAYTPKM